MGHYIYINEFGGVAKVAMSENTLTDLQTMVDGYIEMPSASIAGIACDVVVNEEGLFRQDFSVNFVASAILRQRIVGPAVLARVDNEGNTIGFTDDQIDAIVKDGLEISEAVFTAEEVAERRADILFHASNFEEIL